MSSYPIAHKCPEIVMVLAPRRRERDRRPRWCGRRNDSPAMDRVARQAGRAFDRAPGAESLRSPRRLKPGDAEWTPTRPRPFPTRPQVRPEAPPRPFAPDLRGVRDGAPRRPRARAPLRANPAAVLPTHGAGRPATTTPGR